MTINNIQQSAQINNTNIAENSQINRLSRANSWVSVDNEFKAEKGSFKSFFMDALSQVNEQQNEVTRLNKQIITDPDSVDIHDVTTAMAKAKMSMDLAQTVIDRLVSGWTELSQNR